MKVPPMELSFPGTKVLGYESSSYQNRHTSPGSSTGAAAAMGNKGMCGSADVRMWQWVKSR